MKIRHMNLNDKLAESEKRYRLLAENAADVIWTVDMNMQPTYISPSFERLLGYSIEKAMLMKMERIFTTASYQVSMNVLTEELAKEKAKRKNLTRSRTLELELKHINGSVIPVEVKYTFIRNVDGKPAEILAIARDITKRKFLEKKLLRSNDKFQKAVEGAIIAISSIVEARDPYTAGHQRRVAALASAVAKEMQLNEDQIIMIRIAGILHDIGKVSVPSEILIKPGKLNDSEFNLIKNHPQVGREILKTMKLPWKICPIVLQHHERMNGSGYPQKLLGKHILLEARIMAVADVIEAMASHRPYRPALGIDKALEEISKNKGKLYDAEVVNACVKLFREKRFIFPQ